MTHTAKHPGRASLALYAGNDCGLFRKIQLWPHVTHCADCQAEIERYRSARASLVALTAELPNSIHWDRLAEEMTANIHLGLEAGECVAPFRGAQPEASRSTIDWRAAAVIAAMLLIMAGAWFLNPPARGLKTAMGTAHVEIRTTPVGLEVNENGNSLVLMHGDGRTPATPAMIVSAPGSLRARYVDTDTGQITINHVYSE
jgi:hypothetical protein